MKYSPLGRTGMLVSPLCLGNMMFGSWGNSDHEECVRIVHRALDEGINFVDTADVYSAGESEVITGKAAALPHSTSGGFPRVMRASPNEPHRVSRLFPVPPGHQSGRELLNSAPPDRHLEPW